MPSTFIDSTGSLITFLDTLPECKDQPPSLYIDLEGNALSRHGTLSLITILVQPMDKIYLIDVTILGKDAFEVTSSSGRSLKGILEADDVCKVFFDIRNDSDALYSLYNIRVRNIEDLQLMEFASRNFQKRFLNGLGKCIERDLAMSSAMTTQWQKVKDEGRALFSPEIGGNFEVFDKRPLPPEMLMYCEQDVVHMPALRELYLNKLCDASYVKIMKEGEKRIRSSQSPTYEPHGRHKAVGPSGWGSWRMTATEKQQRTLFRTASLGAAQT